ncbi:unnamed protein product, partial [Prorocentrum cordatum]
DLEASRLTPGALAVLRAAPEPLDFLRSACQEALGPYKTDPLVRGVVTRLSLERWRGARRVAEEWWLLPEADEAARSGACEAAGSGLRACALRVKMSEFLCLTAHVEACDLLRGTVADDQCLAAAPCLAALLRGALGAEGENGFGAASDVRRHLISPACVSGEHICIRTCWF